MMLVGRLDVFFECRKESSIFLLCRLINDGINIQDEIQHIVDEKPDTVAKI